MVVEEEGGGGELERMGDEESIYERGGWGSGHEQYK